MNAAAIPPIVAIACAGCISYLGLDFRPASVVIGLSAAFLVRVPLFSAKTRVLPEASFILLGMLGAFVTIVDHSLGPGNAFWTGLGFGAVAGGLREVAKAAFTGALKARLLAAGRLLFGVDQGAKP